MNTAYTYVKRTKIGFVGYFGLRGIWSRSCGIVRITREDALADATRALNDAMTIGNG